MKKRSTIRSTLSWYFEFPEFEQTHWWNEKRWRWILPRQTSGKRDPIAKKPERNQSEELQAATAWEVLRRHPHTRELLIQTQRAGGDETGLTGAARAGLASRFPEMIKVWLALEGTKCWDSLPEIFRSRIRRAMQLPVADHGTRPSEQPTGIHGNIVRDLYREAVNRAAMQYEARHQPGTPFVFFTGNPVPMETDAEKEALRAAVERELHGKISAAQEDGFQVIALAVCPGTDRSEFTKEVNKLFTTYFPHQKVRRTRIEPLKIIEKFETGDLLRTDAYDKRVADLRPYRELILEFSLLYAFPKPIS